MAYSFHNVLFLCQAGIRFLSGSRVLTRSSPRGMLHTSQGELKKKAGSVMLVHVTDISHPDYNCLIAQYRDTVNGVEYRHGGVWLFLHNTQFELVNIW